MKDPRVRVPAAYAVVLDHLKREIHLGRVAPGERFPPEREHAEMLGVSRVTLREALRVLEGEGLIEVRRGVNGGATVRPTPREGGRAQSLTFDQAMGLQEFRAAVEPLAARRAAERRDEARLPSLARTVDDLAGVVDLGTFRAMDSAFHLLVAELADLPLLLDAVENARIQMFDALDVLDFDIVLASTQRAHRAVADAIAAGDGPEAERRMAEHIKEATAEVMEVYAHLR